MICCHQTRSRKNPCRLCRQIPALYKGVTINVMFKDERLFFIYKQFHAYGIMHPTTIKKLNVRVIMGRILKTCVYLKKTIDARFATFRFPIMQYGLHKCCFQSFLEKQAAFTIASFYDADQNFVSFFRNNSNLVIPVRFQ